MSIITILRIATTNLAALLFLSGTHVMAADTNEVTQCIEKSEILQCYLNDKNDAKIAQYIKEGKKTYAEVFEQKSTMIGTMRKNLMNIGISSDLFDVALINRFSEEGYYEPAQQIGHAMQLCKEINKRMSK